MLMALRLSALRGVAEGKIKQTTGQMSIREDVILVRSWVKC